MTSLDLEITPTIESAEKGMPKIVTGLTVFRILRVLRMLKLSRQMDSINILLMTIRKSSQEIFVLLVMICTLTVIYGTLIFYAEHEMANLDEGKCLNFYAQIHTFDSQLYIFTFLVYRMCATCT